MQTYRYSFTRGDLGTEFVFNETLGFAVFGDEDLVHALPTGELEGWHGEYQADATLAARSLTLSGTILGDDPKQVWERINELAKAFPPYGEGKLRGRILTDDGATTLVDVFLPCRVSGRRVPQRTDEADARDYSVSFRAARPWWADWDFQAPVTIPQAGGTVAVSPGGSEWTAPVFTFQVQNPGTITITPALVSGVSCDSFVLKAAAAGLYVVDFDAAGSSGGAAGDEENQWTVTRGGVSVVTEVAAGGLFELPPAATTFTFALSAGATLAAAGSVKWRRRFAFGV